MTHHVHQLANAADTGVVIRLSEVHRAADPRMHLGSAEFFGGNFLPDGGLHKCRAGKEQPRTFGHQDVIAHHRQVSAAGDAHPHDGGDLRDAHGAHHRVVAEDAAKIVGVGEHVFLKRQENPG